MRTFYLLIYAFTILQEREIKESKENAPSKSKKSVTDPLPLKKKSLTVESEQDKNDNAKSVETVVDKVIENQDINVNDKDNKEKSKLDVEIKGDLPKTPGKIKFPELFKVK